jgi:hypothetical protein
MKRLPKAVMNNRQSMTNYTHTMIRKRIFLPVLLLCCLFFAKAQNKFGDNLGTVNSSSLLELESTNKGFRLPRIVLTDLKVWSPLTGSPTSGMVVYNEKGTLPEGLYYWRTDSAKWGRVIDSLMITKIVSKSLKPTGLVKPSAYYQMAGSTSAFPASPASYTGDGCITYAANEGILLVYTVKGIKAGFPMMATASSSFDDNILIGKVEAISDNLVEVFTYNRTATQLTAENLEMSFSYTFVDPN